MTTDIDVGTWLFYYDLDSAEIAKSASVSTPTIYNRVNRPWKKWGFKRSQYSVYVRKDSPDAKEAIQAAFQEMEKNDIRKYVSRMGLKGPNGEDIDLLRTLEERHANAMELERVLHTMVIRLSSEAEPGKRG